MEKAAGHAGPTHPPSPQKKKLILRTVTVLALFLLLSNIRVPAGSWIPSYGRQTPSASDVSQAEVFDWNTLKTKPYLDYTSCYDGFQCARLELPMDYWNGTTKATISLAVIRQPAVVPITDPRYGGPVLLNPGGPGGSGISLVFRGGKHIRRTIDSADDHGKFFDLVSFDPRGVGETMPPLECVKNARFDHTWQVRMIEEGVFEASDAALGRLWSMSIARDKTCSRPRADGEADLKKYVSTASVARDMLEIAERHGEWREKEAKRLIGSGSKVGCLKPWKREVALPEALAYKPGNEKLQYWGFSYGTYLGNTFAAMFPDRVHRVVVDGVVDAYNYKKALWSDNLFDTEKDLNSLYYNCARAGYPACALANETGDTTAEGVSQRMNTITNSLYHNPLPVVGDNPEVISYSDIKNLIFASLYTPIQSFPYVANLLASVEKGDGYAFAKLLRAYHTFTCAATKGPGYSTMPLRNMTDGSSLSYDATMAIACSDGDDQSHVNKTAFVDYVKELTTVSPSLGSLWSMIRMHCIHYSVRAIHRFEGPWVANTSHPLLMIGNTMDPVTPLRNAHKMVQGFEGAVVLTQNSGGHCSSSAFSNCTVGHIRRYFQTGELPPVNMTCEADELPFGPGPESREVVSMEILAMRKSHAGVSAALNAAGGGLMKIALNGKLRDGWFD